MKNIRILFLATVACIALTTSSIAQTSNERPNIILFLVDDMGWTDTSVPFTATPVPNNSKYHTPSMQKLADLGMRFTNAYAHSVCTPSRVSLVTGMNPARHRVINWTNGTVDSPTDANYEGLKWPEWNYNGLTTNKDDKNTVTATTLPHLISKAGYYTIIAGKGHFAPFGISGSHPKNIGFMESIGSDAIGNPRNYHGTANFGNKEQFGYSLGGGVRGMEEYHGQDIFLTEALTLEAVKAMDKAQDLKVPFFLYMSHYAIHTPFNTDARFYQKYIDKGLEPEEAKYAALIEGMDKSLGDLMKYLVDNKIEKNTVILFMSDNGGLALNPPRQGEAFTHNAPLRSGKGSLYEGGIREPMIAYWPGVIKPGTKTDQNVIIEDFFPSILEIAKVNNYQVSQKTDGVSFVKYFNDKAPRDQMRMLTWHFPSNWGQGESTLRKHFPGMKVEEIGMGPASAIIKGDWKLIYFYGTGKAELYNLSKDLGERNNLANKERAKVRELFSDLTKTLTAQDAQYPISQNSNKELIPALP